MGAGMIPNMLSRVRMMHKTKDELLDQKLVECSLLIGVLSEMMTGKYTASQMRSMAKNVLTRIGDKL
jgi:hypothetical protein